MPAISIDGMSLVYSRRFVKDDVLQEDFFGIKKDSNNLWLPSKLFGNNLNTNGNEGAFSFQLIIIELFLLLVIEMIGWVVVICIFD